MNNSVSSFALSHIQPSKAQASPEAKPVQSPVSPLTTDSISWLAHSSIGTKSVQSQHRFVALDDFPLVSNDSLTLPFLHDDDNKARASEIPLVAPVVGLAPRMNRFTPDFY